MFVISIALPHPQLQINFQACLKQLRQECLQDALLSSVKTLQITRLDSELATYVPEARLKELAGRGLRGEMLYAVPYLLQANPKLLGYYRLLLGYSQKEFYTSKTGMSKVKAMEDRGILRAQYSSLLPDVCTALIGSACDLVDGIGIERITKDLLDDLTLLTLGPQLRGSSNVAKGTGAIEQVWEIIKAIVTQSITQESERVMELQNAAGRKVRITFAADPDVTIQEEMSTGEWRNVLAIEVKGGEDISNIHNRIGEAEKSHQKAKNDGYSDFWTIVNVSHVDPEVVKRESPTTRRFYGLPALLISGSSEYKDFKSRIISFTGIVH